MPVCDDFEPGSGEDCSSESSSSFQADLSTKQRKNDRARGDILSSGGLPFKAEEVGSGFVSALCNKRVGLGDWEYCSQTSSHMEKLHHQHLARDEEGIYIYMSVNLICLSFIAHQESKNFGLSYIVCFWCGNDFCLGEQTRLGNGRNKKFVPMPWEGLQLHASGSTWNSFS